MPLTASNSAAARFLMGCLRSRSLKRCGSTRGQPGGNETSVRGGPRHRTPRLTVAHLSSRWIASSTLITSYSRRSTCRRRWRAQFVSNSCEQIRVNKFVAMSAAAEGESTSVGTSVGQEMSARTRGGGGSHACNAHHDAPHATPGTTLCCKRSGRRRRRGRALAGEGDKGGIGAAAYGARRLGRRRRRACVNVTVLSSFERTR